MAFQPQEGETQPGAGRERGREADAGFGAKAPRKLVVPRRASGGAAPAAVRSSAGNSGLTALAAARTRHASGPERAGMARVGRADLYAGGAAADHAQPHVVLHAGAGRISRLQLPHTLVGRGVTDSAEGIGAQGDVGGRRASPRARASQPPAVFGRNGSFSTLRKTGTQRAHYQPTKSLQPQPVHRFWHRTTR